MSQRFDPQTPLEFHVDPVAASPAEETLWRDGRELVAVVDAPFPERCVKCGCVVRGRAKKRGFHWDSPELIGAFVLNPLRGLLWMMRGRSTHLASICQTHERLRVQAIVAACVVPVASPFVGYAIGGVLGIVATAALFFGAIYAGQRYGRVMTAVKIDERDARFRDVSPDFLARLPALPASAGAR